MENFTDIKLFSLSQQDSLVLVIFHAKWHDKSNKAIEFLKQLNINPKYITVGCLDIDQFPKTALDYSVRFLPWIVLMRKGMVIESSQYLTSVSDLKALLGEDLYEMAVEN